MKAQPPVCLLGALGLMLGFHFLAPLTRQPLGGWRFIGLLPLGTGLAINLLADAALRQAGTTVKPGVKPQALLTSGVYGLSRNPMYFGFLLVLLGVAVFLGSATPFIAVPAFAVFLHVRFIREEERVLEETFGARWIEYRRRVRRWF